MAQVLCEKNKDGMCGGKLKKSLLNTLDKTSLLIGNICSQFCGENLLKELAQKLSQNLNQNSLQMPQFIELEKLAVGSQMV